jgi:hypothetical protein
VRLHLRLGVILSGIALVAFAMRAAAFAQASATVGSSMDWQPLIVTETINWLSWTVWALLVASQGTRVANTSRNPAGRIALVAASVVPAFVVPLLVAAAHRSILRQGLVGAQEYGHVLTHNLPLNILLGVAFIGVVAGYHGLQRAQSLEVTAERLNTQLSRAQLDMLRSQLNPHFLFNALNGITVMARRGQGPQIEAMVTHLAALLRHSLDAASAQRVPLRVEMDALRHYVDIERVRRGDRLAVTIDVPQSLGAVMVPSLLLQPLVENAIRHGADSQEGPLSITVVARRQAARLQVEVTDDGAGLGDGTSHADGVGLGHTRARLAGLYGDDASLLLRPGADGRGTTVLVDLPLFAPEGAPP